MNEGLQALGKTRGFTYLLFLFDVLLLFHAGIANIFHTSDTKILYGLVALLVIQSFIAQMYVVKYASMAEEIIRGSGRAATGKKNSRTKASAKTVEQDRQLGVAMMLSSRIRYLFYANFLVGVLLVLNHVQIHSYIFDKIVVFGAIVLIYFILKYLTILQRGRF